jgi:hypothetical protein
MPSNNTCIPTTKNFTIRSIMRDCRPEMDDPLAPILKTKLETALVVFREDVPMNVAKVKVQYQPEAARREKEALVGLSAPAQRKPSLTLIRGAFNDQPRLVAAGPNGFDDPDPSAA